MKNFIVYSENGQILRSGICPDNDFALQGENVIEGSADDSTHYIENGKIISMPLKPGEFYIFDYEKKEWALDSISADISVRSTRNNLLSLSDWTQLPDVPLQTKQAWAEYRQALRDITDQPGYPFDIVWPQAPN